MVNYANSNTAASEVVQEITAVGGEAIAYQADISQPEEVDNLISETLQLYLNPTQKYRALFRPVYDIRYRASFSWSWFSDTNYY